MESHSRINMVMLGALVRASGFIPPEAAETLCRDTIGKKYPALIEANLAGLRLGYENVKMARGDRNLAPLPDAPADRYAWGYANAPIGGVNPRIGSTVSNDLTASREGYIPLLFRKNVSTADCVTRHARIWSSSLLRHLPRKNCMVNRGLDYYHCKGCLRCVEVCPHRRTRAGTRKKITRKNRIFFRISICCPTPSAIRPSVRIPGSQAILLPTKSGSTEASYKCRQHQ